MREISIVVLLISICVMSLSAQEKTIKGRIISEYLEPLPGVRIQNADTLLFGITDIDGRFSINITEKTQRLILSWVGMEWTTIELTPDCDSIEVIMMIEALYDFTSFKKIDRLRKKRFKKLHKIRESAIKRGIFEIRDVCHTQYFSFYLE